MSRLMAFIDGENLTYRFEAMKKTGLNSPTARSHQYSPAAVIHEPELFVWSPSTFNGILDEEIILRVQYYTTFTGDDPSYEAFRARITRQESDPYRATSLWHAPVRLIPKVFKKTARNTKTKSVDVNICVDVLEYVSKNALDSVFLVTGDVDYLPLIESVMRAGKRVYVAALSDGLSDRLKYETDHFLSLDKIYFT